MQTASDNTDQSLPILLAKIADALDRLAPPPAPAPDFEAADAFTWHAEGSRLIPVPNVNRVDLPLLQGVVQQRDTLLENTRRFAEGLPANNALLWGARGMGKSSLVKAIHAEVAAKLPGVLALVEIHREDIPSLPELLNLLRATKRRFVLFCDDLSFDNDDAAYKSLKAVLDGGIEGRPDNVVFYATSNRRHLMSRDMIENERSTAINPHRVGRGKGVPVRPLRPVARVPQLRPADFLRDDRGLCRPLRPRRAAGAVEGRSDRVVDDARQPVGPRRVAVHPGFGRPSWEASRLTRFSEPR